MAGRCGGEDPGPRAEVWPESGPLRGGAVRPELGRGSAVAEPRVLEGEAEFAGVEAAGGGVGGEGALAAGAGGAAGAELEAGAGEGLATTGSGLAGVTRGRSSVAEGEEEPMAGVSEALGAIGRVGLVAEGGAAGVDEVEPCARLLI